MKLSVKIQKAATQ